MITSETCLLDTNILVYAADETSPFHQDAKALREKGMKGEMSLCICPQVLSEYFAIITDPKRVNEPRTQKEAVPILFGTIFESAFLSELCTHHHTQ